MGSEPNEHAPCGRGARTSGGAVTTPPRRPMVSVPIYSSGPPLGHGVSPHSPISKPHYAKEGEWEERAFDRCLAPAIVAAAGLLAPVSTSPSPPIPPRALWVDGSCNAGSFRGWGSRV